MHKRAQSRVQRFLSRVDGYLAALDDAALGRNFLDRQVAAWECRYSRFLATEGASEPGRDAADPPHAAYFLLTIAALAKRRNALSEGGTMSEAKSWAKSWAKS